MQPQLTAGRRTDNQAGMHHISSSNERALQCSYVRKFSRNFRKYRFAATPSEPWILGSYSLTWQAGRQAAELFYDGAEILMMANKIVRKQTRVAARVVGRYLLRMSVFAFRAICAPWDLYENNGVSGCFLILLGSFIC